MKINLLPNLVYLNECFILSEKSPSGLIWKKRPYYHFPTVRGCNITNASREGKHAGCLSINSETGDRYYSVGIEKKLYRAHRIVYSMYNNVELSDELNVDHEDGNSLNNNPVNLRLATSSQNRFNSVLRSDNTLNYKGVSYKKDRNVYRGNLWFNGKHYYLGCSPCKETMNRIVREEREKLHKEFTNHGN